MRSVLFINATAVIFLLCLCAVSITTGVADFHWADISQPEQLRLLLASRLPRTAAALLTGATLAVAGMVLQIVLRNRFVEPSMVGATQSAALGILVCSLLWPSVPVLAKMSAASVAALLGMTVFLLLIRRIPPQHMFLLPLIGLVYSNIIEAAATFVAIDTDSAQMLSVWLSGDFSGVLAGRYELLWLTGIMAAAVYFLADRLSIAGLGRDISIGLGVSYERMLWLALIVVAMISAMVVVTVGQIPFIGLVVPNLVSRLCGDHLRRNLPTVALFGATALLTCDIGSRTLNAPYEIPVSLVFGMVGTVLFLYLLLRKAKSHAA